MRIVLRSLDGLSTSFVDPTVDNDPPIDSYATPLPPGSGADVRFYDFEGSRRDDDAAGETVRVYRERKPAPVVRELVITTEQLTGDANVRPKPLPMPAKPAA